MLNWAQRAFCCTTPRLVLNRCVAPASFREQTLVWRPKLGGSGGAHLCGANRDLPAGLAVAPLEPASLEELPSEAAVLSAFHPPSRCFLSYSSSLCLMWGLASCSIGLNRSLLLSLPVMQVGAVVCWGCTAISHAG